MLPSTFVLHAGIRPIRSRAIGTLLDSSRGAGHQDSGASTIRKLAPAGGCRLSCSPRSGSSPLRSRGSWPEMLGDAGKINVFFYGTTSKNFMDNKANWIVYMSQSQNALAMTPTFSIAPATPYVIHTGGHKYRGTRTRLFPQGCPVPHSRPRDESGALTTPSPRYVVTLIFMLTIPEWSDVAPTPSLCCAKACYLQEARAESAWQLRPHPLRFHHNIGC